MNKKQRIWDQIDRIATREARALARARKYHTRHRRAVCSRSMERHQALFDEHLEVHHEYCSFCGRLLREDPLPAGEPTKKSIYGQEADICRSCAYLAAALFRKPALAKPALQDA